MRNNIETPELRRPSAVWKQIGVSASTGWRMVQRDPTFPQPVKIAPRVTAFDGGAVDAWIHARIAEARKAAA